MLNQLWHETWHDPFIIPRFEALNKFSPVKMFTRQLGASTNLPLGGLFEVTPIWVGYEVIYFRLHVSTAFVLNS